MIWRGGAFRSLALQDDGPVGSGIHGRTGDGRRGWILAVSADESRWLKSFGHILRPHVCRHARRPAEI